MCDGSTINENPFTEEDGTKKTNNNNLEESLLEGNISELMCCNGNF